MTTQEFVEFINNKRKANKNKWYWFCGLVNKQAVEVKGFETWLQVLRIDGINHFSAMDINVKQFKQNLKQAVQ